MICKTLSLRTTMEFAGVDLFILFWAAQTGVEGMQRNQISLEHRIALKNQLKSVYEHLVDMCMYWYERISYDQITKTE